MLPAGFEPAVQASERSQTHALDRADTAIGTYIPPPPKKKRVNVQEWRTLPTAVVLSRS
jgi:hypothetical protein